MAFIARSRPLFGKSTPRENIGVQVLINVWAKQFRAMASCKHRLKASIPFLDRGKPNPAKTSRIAPLLDAKCTARKRNLFTIKEFLEFVL